MKVLGKAKVGPCSTADPIANLWFSPSAGGNQTFVTTCKSGSQHLCWLAEDGYSISCSTIIVQNYDISDGFYGSPWSLVSYAAVPIYPTCCTTLLVTYESGLALALLPDCSDIGVTQKCGVFSTLYWRPLDLSSVAANLSCTKADVVMLNLPAGDGFFVLSACQNWTVLTTFTGPYIGYPYSVSAIKAPAPVTVVRAIPDEVYGILVVTGSQTGNWLCGGWPVSLTELTCNELSPVNPGKVLDVAIIPRQYCANGLCSTCLFNSFIRLQLCAFSLVRPLDHLQQYICTKDLEMALGRFRALLFFCGQCL